MDKIINIGRWEAIAILINMICVKIILNYPRNMAEVAGTAGWLLPIYISFLVLIAFLIIKRLYTPFEGQDLVDVGEHIAGSAGRIAVGIIIIALLVLAVSINLRIFSEDMKIVALTTSPISYVTVFFVVCMSIGAYLGIEAIARYHAIIIPIIAAGYIIILAGVSPYINVMNVFPILGNGANFIFIQGSLKTGIFMEFIILFLLVPFIKTHKNFKRVGYFTLGISSFFLIISVFVYLCVIPYPDAQEKVLPLYHLARLVNIGRFFQRIESIFVVIWATAGLMYITVGLFFIAYLFQKTFKLKHYKPLILPFSVLLFTLSLVPDSLIQASYFDLDFIREWGWVPSFVLPVLLLLMARLIKRKAPKK